MASPSGIVLRRWALALFVATIVLDVAFVMCADAVRGDPGLTYPDAGLEQSEVVGIVLAGLVGLVITWLRPHNPVGWLLAASGLFLAACDAGQFYGAMALLGESDLPLGAWALAVSASLWIPSLLIGPTFMLVRYPSGQIDGRWPRRFDRLAIGAMLLLCLGYSATENAVTDMVADAEHPLGGPAVIGEVLAGVGGVGVLVALVAIVGDAVRRLVRASDRSERIALALVLGTGLAAVAMAWFGPAEWTLTAAWYAAMLAVAIGVLRYGALGIEVTVLTGGGGDPFAALSRLGAPLGGDVDERSLTDVLEALREALGVDGVAVDGPVRAVAGTLPDRPTAAPLQFAGGDLGVLQIGDRPGNEAIGRSGRRVVEAVAPLIAAVLHAVQVAEQLRGQQERVVAATQAERLRLRQELHDGLGPALTGIGLGLEALSTRVPQGSEDLVTRLRTEVAGSLEETRRIIDDLRPSALDDGDLGAALGRRAEQIRASGLDVDVRIPAELPMLPAAVSAAVFRIAEEALTNVVRHAGATHVRLAVLRTEDEVVLEVQDDGVGPGPGRVGSVGVASMRDRAERLGGRFELANADPGTRVRAVLPLVVT
jgi:signal transduction histidine kinase